LLSDGTAERLRHEPEVTAAIRVGRLAKLGGILGWQRLEAALGTHAVDETLAQHRSEPRRQAAAAAER
jgi:hypothetical protein